ncbi:hypothetical protein J6590_026309 [Homalodisca vitripennis]|nr:hypothetical protein J6590_026309 [Homalodisca vitripennis]
MHRTAGESVAARAARQPVALSPGVTVRHAYQAPTHNTNIAVMATPCLYGYYTFLGEQLLAF